MPGGTRRSDRTSGKVSQRPEPRGHSVFMVLLVTRVGSASPSQAQACTILPAFCRTAPRESKRPFRADTGFLLKLSLCRGEQDPPPPRPRLWVRSRPPHPGPSRRDRPGEPGKFPDRVSVVERAGAPRWGRRSSGLHSRSAEIAGRIRQNAFGPLVLGYLPARLGLPPAPESFFSPTAVIMRCSAWESAPPASPSRR